MALRFIMCVSSFSISKILTEKGICAGEILNGALQDFNKHNIHF